MATSTCCCCFPPLFARRLKKPAGVTSGKFVGLREGEISPRHMKGCRGAPEIHILKSRSLFNIFVRQVRRNPVLSGFFCDLHVSDEVKDGISFTRALFRNCIQILYCPSGEKCCIANKLNACYPRRFPQLSELSWRGPMRRFFLAGLAFMSSPSLTAI